KKKKKKPFEPQRFDPCMQRKKTNATQKGNSFFWEKKAYWSNNPRRSLLSLPLWHRSSACCFCCPFASSSSSSSSSSLFLLHHLLLLWHNNNDDDGGFFLEF